MPRGREGEFQREIVRLAQLNGWSVWWTHDSRHSPAGWPDLVLARQPVLIYRECKTDDRRSKVTPDQVLTLELLKACGQDAGVWRPADWPEIIETLTRRHR